MKILIVEDEQSLLDILRRTLLQERYVVESATTYAAAEEKIALYGYDCILLDINLPDGSGLDLLDRIKSESRHGGVIIISARDSIDDKVRGLGAGADDYLSKPFHLAELSARIKSVARRRDGVRDTSLSLGNVVLQPDSGLVSVQGNQVELLRKEFDILRYFMRRPNHIVDKMALAEAVWGDHMDQADDFSFVYAQVKNIRRKLQAAGASIEIRSVYGFGYKLVELQ